MPHDCPLHPKRPDLKCGRCRATTLVGVKSDAPPPPPPGPLTALEFDRQDAARRKTPPPAARRPLPIRQPCQFEGVVVERCTQCGAAGELNHVRDCERFDVNATRGPNNGAARSCAACFDYRPPSRFPTPAATPPGVGIAIGCYGLPQLTRLHVRLIRDTCGGVPILIADDGSGRDAEFERIVAAEEGVEFWPSDQRLGHYAGDLSVVWKGLQWAETRGLKWLCKISMRFLWTEQDWLKKAVALADAGGEATLMQRCTDAGPGNGGKPVDLKIRSECFMVDAAAWSPFRAEMKQPRLNNPTEFFFWHVVHREWGERFTEWAPLTVNRYAPTPGTLWHGSHNRAAYERLADSYGLPLDPEFYTNGHQNMPGWKRG